MYKEYVDKAGNMNVKLDKEFKAYDAENFKCKCGCGKTVTGLFWINFMNYLYAQTKKYYHVTSGVRCEEHNRYIGGKDYWSKGVHKLSDHVTELAIDVDYSTLEERSEISFWASNFGIQRQIVYAGNKTFIHLSINEELTNPLLIFNYNGEII